MKFNELFGNAKVLSFDDKYASVNTRQIFYLSDPGQAALNIVGLGFFEVFINGIKVSDDLFLPLDSEFHKRDIVIRDKPFEEEFGHRIYVTSYDVSKYLVSGKNVICVMLGNGWYADDHQLKFGQKKLFYRISVIDNGNVAQIVSDESMRFMEGFVKSSRLTHGEEQDFRNYCDDWMKPDFSDEALINPDISDIPDTEYCYSDCPPDRIVESYIPVLLSENNGIKYYDIGINCSGRVILRLTGKEGDRVTVLHSEEKRNDNTIDSDCCCWNQISSFISDGKEREVHVMFTWNAFRYFSVEGNAEVIRFERVHTDCRINSDFRSNNKVLNWIYSSFVNTQLSNMHSGIPSDCPHIERRGYTGDGELACNAGMTVLDSRAFYRKWLYDISDCQDRKTGHVQYTAPYTHSGGGPGGWGCAIVHVPFMYYRHFGDIGPMKEMLPGMIEYFRFLDDHSDNDLIVSDIPDEWCLGDWCTAKEIKIPEPFVNDYFYVRSIDEILSLKRELGLSDLFVVKLMDKRKKLTNALVLNYYDDSTGDFCEMIQGANAFAVDIGLGDERTYNHLVEYYRKEEMYDTGIFGTDVVTRLLFEKGDGDIAYNLLSSEKEFSFGNMMNHGSTTLWEYWYGKRSHSHPMFGAVTSYLFEYLLGINFCVDKCVVSPVYPGKDEHFTGYRETALGKISVEVVYSGLTAEFNIENGFDVQFSFDGVDRYLQAGTHSFKVNMEEI